MQDLCHLTELRFYVPLDTNYVIVETFLKPISWLCMEKQNLTQQKDKFTNQKKCTTTQKTKGTFSPILRHPAWKRRRPILIPALHKFVTQVYLLKHLPTTYSPGTHMGHLWH